MPLAERYWDEITRLLPRRRRPDRALARDVRARSTRIKRRLDALAIERLHVEGDGRRPRVTVGEQRRWLGGTGRNIPSFEIFTSPDWRGTEGTSRSPSRSTATAG